MTKGKLVFTSRVPISSAIYELMCVEDFSDVILPPAAIPLRTVLSQFKFVTADIVYPYQINDLARFCEQLESTDVVLSAGLVAKNNDAIRAVIEFINQISVGGGPWFLTATEAIQYTAVGQKAQILKHGLQLADLGAASENFDFGLLATRPRFFNHLDFKGNLIRKCSFRFEKARAEARFFMFLPPQLQSFFPRFISSNESESEFCYDLEQKRFFDLGRLSIQNSLTDSQWALLKKRLGAYFSMVPKRSIGAGEIRASRKNYFVKKLLDRYQEFVQHPSSAAALKVFKAETGVPFSERIDRLIEEIENHFNSLGSSHANTEVYFSHGDLCLSNMLFHPQTGELCFIDPRGAASDDEFYRPVEYDLAKLTQSFLGAYEFILAEKTPTANWRRQATLLQAQIIAEFALPQKYMRLCEASLFWSLLPLHIDQPEKLARFMLAGETAFLAGV
jgi:hypothetical protein